MQVYDTANRLAQEIRDYILEVVSKNGGHLASNLGIEIKGTKLDT